jgi:hypothetical protein
LALLRLSEPPIDHVLIAIERFAIDSKVVDYRIATGDEREGFSTSTAGRHSESSDQMRMIPPGALDPDSHAGRIARATAELRVFLNDPVALIGRAMELLQGTAEPIA